MTEGQQINRYRDPDTFEVRAAVNNLAEAARNNKLLITLTVLVTMGLVVFYAVTFPPIYTATAMVMIERDMDPIRDAFYVGWDVFRKDDGKTEIELMTSAPVLQEVVEREHLAYRDVYHPFMSQLTYLWQESAIGKMYHDAKKRLLGGEQEVGSKEIRELVRTMFDMRSGISIDVVADTNAGRITVKGPTGEIAARIANRLVDVYLTQRQQRHVMEAKKSEQILQQELNGASEELKAREAQRTAYALSHGLMIDFQKEQVQVGKLIESEQTISGIESKIAGMEASLQEIDRRLASEPAVKTTSTVYEMNALRENAKAKRMDLQIALISARERYQENSPEVSELRNSIAQLDKMIDSTSEKVAKATTEGLNAVQQDLLSRRTILVSDLEGARASLTVDRRSRWLLKTQLTNLPQLQSTVRALDRDIALAQEKYSQLATKHAQALVSAVTANATMPSMRIVEVAGVPSEKTWPKPKVLYPSAFFVALILGLTGAMARSYASGRVRREHVERGRGDAPLYGTVAIPIHSVPLVLQPGRGNGRTGAGAA